MRAMNKRSDTDPRSGIPVGAVGAIAAGSPRGGDARARRRPWGDTPVCAYCGSPSTVRDKSGALLCASCAERMRLIRIIKAMLRRRGTGDGA